MAGFVFVVIPDPELATEGEGTLSLPNFLGRESKRMNTNQQEFAFFASIRG
jgi:hypothetical protein